MKSPFDLNSARASTSDLARAAEILDDSGVVGLPTETVYGLAARIDRPEALKLIFRTKERPLFDPLIVHVASLSQARDLSASWSPVADFLARRYWPGPLTLVVQKREDRVHPLISSGLETVALRSPDHPLALQLIGAAGPLAAPSANRFGHTSPTLVDHVRKEFPEIFCLDGGACRLGVESTVIDVTKPDEVIILRPGLISATEIEAALERILPRPRLRIKASAPHQDATLLESPGQLAHHYEPRLPLILLPPETPSGELSEPMRSAIVAQVSSLGDSSRWFWMDLSEEVAIAARQLYAQMREGEVSGADAILCRWPAGADDPRSPWAALGDRLRKASRHHLHQRP